VAGARIDGDWYDGRVPGNIQVGEGTVIDSTFGFKQFYSTAVTGLRIGRNCTLWRTTLATERVAVIDIGDDCYIANAALVSAARITVGSRVLIAGGVTIADSDFHPMDPAARLADTVALSPRGRRDRRPAITARPVVIEDEVWIGWNATILKGVRIGAGAIVHPGSVVTHNVEPGCAVAGNPARTTADGASGG
jgi:acetyltransferase-like isoleucine patch superfamily enzyme